MHRTSRTGFGMAVLTLLVLAGVLATGDRPAAASDQSPGSAPHLPAADANAVFSAPYLSLGVALTRSQDTRFADGEDAGHAALYGSEELFDAGAIDAGLQSHLAVSVRLPYRLRVQLEFGLARDLDWRGNANYRASGGRQPSEASLASGQLLLAGFYDLPGWEIARTAGVVRRRTLTP